MSEIFKLVFKGEVHEGQHPAVVRKRIGKALKLDDATVDTLFSGKTVILRDGVDKPTAARFQAMFKQAGARLRVVATGEQRSEEPVQTSAPAAQSEPAVAEVGASADTPRAEVASPTEPLAVLPLGSELLTESERGPAQPPADVATDHLAVHDAGDNLVEPKPEENVPAPDTSHMSVAEVGEDLQQRKAAAPPPVDIPISDFEVAEVGSDVLPAEYMKTATVLEIDLDAFDLAALGEYLDPTLPGPAPEPPDTSHLSVERD